MTWLLVFVLFFSVLGLLPYVAEPQTISQQKPPQQTLTYATPTRAELFDQFSENENYGLIDEYIFTFDFEVVAYEFYDESWQVIEIEGCINNFIPWQPRVPIKNIIIDTEDEVIDVEVSFLKPIELSSFKLPPSPEPENLISPKAAGIRRINSMNEHLPITSSEQEIQRKIDEYFSINYYYPEHEYLLTEIDRGLGESGNLNKYGLQIFPCKYNPYLQNAIIFQQVEVRVYSATPETIGEPQGEGTTGGGSRGDSREPDEEFEFLILTTEPLMDELEKLADWKIRKGMSTRIIDVASIYDNESFDGYDEPEELRNFIMHAYQTFEVEYVLLAGDYDTVPPRMCYDPNPYYGADDGEIPSDSYYACITEGTTWDVDGDYIYGEIGDLDDIYPDIAVGRIAINSEEKMAAWIDEVINYECNPGTENWTSKAILIGPNVHNEGDGAEQNEYFYDTYLKYIYDSFDKFYESSEEGNKPFSKNEIVKSINTGSTLLNYLGHGGPTVWTYNYGYNVLFNKGDVNGLSNSGMKPVVYSMSCLTQWFDDPSDSGYGNFGDCIGETFTENVEDAGIGYIGSARTSVGSVGNGYGPFATGLQEDFIRQLSQYNFVLGEAFTDGKKHYSESFGHYFDDYYYSGEVQACWLEVNLLGDPSLPLWTSVPQQLNVTNLSTENTLIITVKTADNQPVKGALVCLQKASGNNSMEIFEIKQTSSSGDAVFDVTAFPSSVNLTITKINSIPYLERLSLKDLIPPETYLEITPQAPDGENGWYVTTPYISLTVNEDAVIYYFWDDENESNGEQVYFEPIPVPEGMHTLYYYSVDLSDNKETVHQMEIYVDLTPPVCELNLVPEKPDGRHGWYIQQPTINITSEPEATIYYAFNDDLSLNFPGSIVAPEGINEFHYYSRDIAGNQGEIVTVTFKVDLTTPITNLSQSPEFPTGSNGWYLSSPLISLETEEKGEIYYYWDDSELNVTYQYFDPIECPEGIHTLYYYSIDYAGCQEEIRSKNIRLDTISPITTFEIIPETPDGENEFYVSDVKITLSSEPSTIIYYYFDSDYPQIYDRPIKGIEGIHTLTYYSQDEAGNTGDKVMRDLKIDTIAPELSLKVTPSESSESGWYTVIPSIEFEGEPDTVVYYHFEYTTPTAAQSQIAIPEGINQFYYYSVDSAGNVGNTKSMNFKVDITPPRARLETDMLTYQVYESITFDAMRSEDNFEVLEYHFDFGDGESSGWTIAPIVRHKYDKPGDYEVVLHARDQAGVESTNIASVTVLIVAEDDDASFFDMNNLLFIILIIIIIFITLSGSFMFVHRSYRERSELTASYHPASIEPRAQAYVSMAEAIEAPKVPDDEIREAIILDSRAIQKLRKIKCAGCGTVFTADPTTDELRCPGCGSLGNVGKARKGISAEKESKTNKFKCPACDTVFNVSISRGMVKCPRCGITGGI